MESIFVFIFGAVVGSFLNVCIYRMPREQSIVLPRSFCTACKKSIVWYDNIPLISYIVLGGECRFCKAKISARYWIVELITALVFFSFYRYFGFGFRFFYYTLFVCGLIVATFIDIEHRIIPDEISLGGIGAGLLLNVSLGLSFRPFAFSPRPLAQSFLGVLIGGGVIYLTGFLFDLVYFKLLKKPPIQGETESMGGGDVKLLAMMGAFLGWEKALLIFFLAPFFGAVVGIINLVAKKDHTIPYGPFLSLAALIALFWADSILSLVFMR